MFPTFSMIWQLTCARGLQRFFLRFFSDGFTGNSHVRADCNHATFNLDFILDVWQLTCARGLQPAHHSLHSLTLELATHMCARIATCREWTPFCLHLSGNSHVRADCNCCLFRHSWKQHLATHMCARIATYGSISREGYMVWQLTCARGLQLVYTTYCIFSGLWQLTCARGLQQTSPLLQDGVYIWQLTCARGLQLKYLMHCVMIKLWQLTCARGLQLKH